MQEVRYYVPRRFDRAYPDHLTWLLPLSECDLLAIFGALQTCFDRWNDHHVTLAESVHYPNNPRSTSCVFWSSPCAIGVTRHLTTRTLFTALCVGLCVSLMCVCFNPQFL